MFPNLETKSTPQVSWEQRLLKNNGKGKGSELMVYIPTHRGEAAMGGAPDRFVYGTKKTFVSRTHCAKGSSAKTSFATIQSGTHTLVRRVTN